MGLPNHQVRRAARRQVQHQYLRVVDLGLALVQLGQYDEAERQFEIKLRLAPTNAKAADYLEQTKALKQRKP